VRVLVVDDEPSLAELLASVLRYEGWTVKTAGNGADAVRTAREFRPDAVVLDIMLPDFNGLEVMRRLRAEVPQVCVLFLTARDAVEDRVAGITAGGDDYVTKPFSPAARPAAPVAPDPRAHRGTARGRRPDHGRGRPRGP
jgi:two-component system OmpR family response regulator